MRLVNKKLREKVIERFFIDRIPDNIADISPAVSMQDRRNRPKPRGEARFPAPGPGGAMLNARRRFRYRLAGRLHPPAETVP